MISFKSFSIAGLVLFIFTGLLFSSVLVSAEDRTAFGELHAKGDVFIGSDDKTWMPSGSSYPLLQNTVIKTENGFASLFLNDSSRIDISKETVIAVHSSDADHTVKLSKGVVAFNIIPSSSLTVRTPSASVSVRKSGDVVHKVSISNDGRVLGVITVSEKGTEVKSITGMITVSTEASVIKSISTGESIFVGTDQAMKVYKTQAGEIIQKGDRLEIKTNGLEGIYKVDAEGNIKILNINVRVEGLTEDEAAKLVADVLSKQPKSTLVNILDDEIIGALFPAGENLGAAAVATLFAGTTVVISTKDDGPWDDDKKFASPFIP